MEGIGTWGEWREASGETGGEKARREVSGGIRGEQRNHETSAGREGEGAETRDERRDEEGQPTSGMLES